MENSILLNGYSLGNISIYDNEYKAFRFCCHNDHLNVVNWLCSIDVHNIFDYKKDNNGIIIDWEINEEKIKKNKEKITLINSLNIKKVNTNKKEICEKCFKIDEYIIITQNNHTV